MNMILKAAVASAIAVAAVGTSHALDIAGYAAATNVNVFVSGSTAVDNTLINTAILTAAPGGLCQAGTIDIHSIGKTNTLI